MLLALSVKRNTYKHNTLLGVLVFQVGLDFECIYLSHRECVPADNEVVCATDGYTYANL